MQMEFDVKRFLDALGTKPEIAKFMGLSRTAPYGWEKRGYLSSVTMAHLVEYSQRRGLSLDVNEFFVRRAKPSMIHKPKGGTNRKGRPPRKGKGKRNGRG